MTEMFLPRCNVLVSWSTLFGVADISTPKSKNIWMAGSQWRIGGWWGIFWWFGWTIPVKPVVKSCLVSILCSISLYKWLYLFVTSLCHWNVADGYFSAPDQGYDDTLLHCITLNFRLYLPRTLAWPISSGVVAFPLQAYIEASYMCFSEGR